MTFDPNIIVGNLASYIQGTSNNVIILLILGISTLVCLLDYRTRRLAVFSLAWFIVCILPYIFLFNHFNFYYLSAALLGAAVLFSSGIHKVLGKISDKKLSVAITAVIIIALMISAQLNINGHEQDAPAMIQERLYISVLNALKESHPTFPDHSLVHIKDADDQLYAAMGYGDCAVKLYYGDGIAVYYENVSKSEPTGYDHKYYYKYGNGTLQEIQ
jgi:hypothetical protein